jgi:site-specific DNA recombinase
MSHLCAMYARYSTDRQSPCSIEDQVRKCREFAARQSWHVLENHIYADEAISGANSERAALQRLLTAAIQKPRPFDVVLIDDTSRLSRKISESLSLSERLKFAGVRVLFVSQGIDSDSEQAEVLLATHGIVDSLYIHELGKKVRRGIEGLALKKLHTGGRCFGYRSVPIESANQKDQYGRPLITGARLVVEPPEAETVQRIFTLYAGGSSFKRIAKQLNAEHVVSPQPQKGKQFRSWCPSSVRTVLHNERYRGVVGWGRTKKIRDPKTGKRVYRRKPESEWVSQEIPEQRIITSDLWNRVQARIEIVKGVFGNAGRKGGLLRARAASSPYLFSGLLKCGLCGANMVIVSGRGRNHGTSHYGCPIYALRGICRNSLRIGRDVLERELLSKIQGEVLRDEVVNYTLMRFEEELEKALGRIGGEMDQMRKRKVELESEIARLTAGLASGIHSPAVMAEIAKRESEISGISDRLLASGPDSVRSQIKGIRSFVISRLAEVRDLLNSDPVTTKTEIAKHVSKITLEPRGRTYQISGSWDLLGTTCANGVCRGAESNCLRRPFQGRALPMSYLGTGTTNDSTEKVRE